MALLSVLTLPDKRLRQGAKSVSRSVLLKPETQQFIDDLIVTMHEKDGIGLAAMQVGSPMHMFTIATESGNEVFVNATIVKKSWQKAIDEEGCLSVPGVYGMVKRHQAVMVKAMDRQGNEVLIKAKGLLARVFQHEIDHLNGILFVDKVIRYTKGEETLPTFGLK